MIRLYLAELEQRGRSELTVKAARAWLERFERFCQERSLKLAEVTPAVLAAYHTRLLWQPHAAGRLFAPHSVDQGLRHVRAFLRWAVAAGRLQHDPTEGLILERPQSRPRAIWSPAEQDAALSLPDISAPVGLRDRALLGLFFEASLSLPQCAGLDLADFDAASYRLATHRGRQRKGPLELLLSDGLAELLRHYLAEGRPLLRPAADDPALFLSVSGRRFQPLHLSQVVRGYLRQASSSLNRRP